MVQFMPNPQLKVVVGALATTFINRKTTKVEILGVENGFAVATVVITDKDIENMAHMGIGGDLDIYVKDATETSWFQMFDGKIRQSAEHLGLEGETAVLKGDGSGWGLAEGIVYEEYGSQSRRPTCDSIQDILTNASYGIVPAWVNHILGNTGNDSGHNINTDHVASIGDTIPYVYFGGKPASKCICDLIDLGSAFKGAASAGPHFIILPGDILCVDLIGSHSAGSAGHGWTNYICGQSAANNLSTLVQANKTTKGHFHLFNFQKLDQYANYMLYYAPCIYPVSQDGWTEAVAADWDTDGGATVTIGDTVTQYIVGAKSLGVLETANIGPFHVWFNDTVDLGLNLNALGGKYSIPSLNFLYRHNDQIDTGPGLGIWLCTSITDFSTLDVDAYYTTLAMPNDDKWGTYNLPVGENWPLAKSSALQNSIFGGWQTMGSPDWSDINAVGFAWTTKGALNYNYIDGLHFAGWVLRGAKDGTSITANKLRARFINDPFAKYDTLIASDDSGIAAQFAKAELLRGRTTPRLGTFQTRLVRNAWPGQLLHIHARPNKDASTYNVNSDFRLSKITHLLDGSGGGKSTWEVTDDLYNARTREAYTSWNTILQAVRPEYQDRQSTGTKLRDTDVTQVILEKDYF